MSGLDKEIRFISGHIVSILLRTVGYTTFGVILNIALAWSQWDLLSDPDTPLMSASKSGAILLSATIFPIVFFVIGQMQGIQSALSKLLKDRKYDLVFWIVSKIQEKHPDVFEREGKAQMTALKVLEYLTEITRDLPAIIVRAFRYLIKKIDFSSLFVEAVKSDTGLGNDESKAERISLVISNMIPADVISPNIKLPLFVLVLNCAMFFI